MTIFNCTCNRCGVVFNKTAIGGRMPEYCSEDCRRAQKLKRDKVNNPRIGIRKMICAACGISFEGVRSRECCSSKCRNRVKALNREPKVCKACGKNLEYVVGRGKGKEYCSSDCVPKIKNAGHGYVLMFNPTHPLADKRGWQYEHRIILYDHIGAGWHKCHWCAKPITWEQHYNANGVGVDHLDFNKSNNEIVNLVPVCRKCNCKRRRKHGRTPSIAYKLMQQSNH